MKLRYLALAILALLGVSGQAQASSNTEAPTAVDLSQEPSVPDSVKVNTADSQRYAFTITAKNARMQMKVNDVPVLFKIFRDSATIDISYNEWLKRGLNIIDIQVERFSDQEPYKVTYSVYFQSPTQIISGERKVLYASPEHVSLPLRQPVGIRVPSTPLLRIWQTEKIEFTPDEKQRLVDSINSLRNRMIDALSKSDNAFLATYDKPIRDEIEMAYGRITAGEQDTMKRRMELAEQLRKMVNAQVVSSPVLKAEDLVFDMIGDGYLVRVTRLDGGPVINVSRGDLVFTINKPIYGTIGGLWDMLRNN